jgi:acyl-CoA reductase-like NAD-dependent aldehyde dehydrogenase
MAPRDRRATPKGAAAYCVPHKEREDDLVTRELANTGIPVRQIRERHVRRAAMNFEFFADFIGQALNESYEQEAPFLTIVRREPVGVAALIAPWNAPLAWPRWRWRVRSRLEIAAF